MKKKPSKSARHRGKPTPLKTLKRSGTQYAAYAMLREVGAAEVLPPDLHDVCRQFGNQMTQLMATFGGDDASANVIRAAANDPLVEQLFALAYERGFMLAVLYHAKALNIRPEAVAALTGREVGQSKGHDTQSARKQERKQKILAVLAELESAGKPCTYDAVAAACGCSRSTVDRAINGRATKRTKR